MPYRESTMSWLSARAACKELDPSADLASSTSVSENSFLSSLDDSSTCTNFMWLGGTNAHTEEGEWTWSDGSPFIFENWQSGEGDDGPLEDCLGLYTVDQDKNDQGTTDILEPAGFLVSDQFHGRNMFDFLF